MALARVVSFDGVSAARVAELQTEIQDQEPPEGLRPTEILMLHDADAERAVVVLFFANEQDYADGDAVLDAMPADDTPGRRTAVTKYDVAMRFVP